MTRNTLYVAIGLLGLSLIIAIYSKRCYDSRYRFENAIKQVNELSDKDELRNGDIVFQTSLSGQSKAIQLATHSKFSHCGLINESNNKYFVFEAVQPVKQTPLDEWIARGQGGHFVIKRLKNAEQVLTSETLKRMKQVGDSFIGKNYDNYFDWSDDKTYCSELIWKIYYRATGLRVGKLEKLRDFDLTNDVVKQKIKERYGNNIPLEDTVISPASIFNSELLITIKSN